MSIREATHDDLDGLVTMGRRFLSSLYTARLADNPAQLRAFAQTLIDGDDSLVLVSENGERVVGMIAFMVYAHPMSGDRTAAEIFWWVEPEHRGVGLKLLKLGEQWCKEKGATILQMVAPTPAVETFYGRIGFDRIESVWQRSLA